MLKGRVELLSEVLKGAYLKTKKLYNHTISVTFLKRQLPPEIISYFLLRNNKVQEEFQLQEQLATKATIEISRNWFGAWMTRNSEVVINKLEHYIQDKMPKAFYIHKIWWLEIVITSIWLIAVRLIWILRQLLAHLDRAYRVRKI